MKTRPILFSGPMIRAILDGRKTQTRRTVKPQPPAHLGDMPGAAWDAGFVDVRCPYGEECDRLWVREAWKQVARGTLPGPITYGYAYAADDEIRWGAPCVVSGAVDPGPVHLREAGAMDVWKPPLFMPRRASRITLEITGVRVQRLQDISEEDAIAEGAPDTRAVWEGVPGNRGGPREWYAALWDTLNSTRASWASNPWMWAITFRDLKNQGGGERT